MFDGLNNSLCNADLVFDKESFLEKIDNDLEAFDSFIDISKTEFEKNINKVNDFIKNNDIEGLKLVVHTLKGASDNLCFSRLSKVCRQIENALRDGNEISDLISLLNSEWLSLREILNSF